MSRSNAIQLGRKFIRRQIVTENVTADLYRNPAEAGGKTAARVLTTEAIPIILRPVSTNDSTIKLISLAKPLNAARVRTIGKLAIDVDVRNGDELRSAGVRYLIEGVGIWSTMRLTALSEIKGGGLMPNSVIVQGYEAIQNANRKLLHSMKPSGALGKAVLYGTVQMQRGVITRAHRDTGTYAASQKGDVQGLTGRVYTASNRNPKSGTPASVYGPYEEARGGSHAAYANTFKADAPGVMVEAIRLVIAALP